MIQASLLSLWATTTIFSLFRATEWERDQTSEGLNPQVREQPAKISLTNGAGARGQKANNKENQVENLLEGLYYEMVLAPFYQDFMKSLDEHINELVEGTGDLQPS